MNENPRLTRHWLKGTHISDGGGEGQHTHWNGFLNPRILSFDNVFFLTDISARVKEGVF